MSNLGRGAGWNKALVNYAKTVDPKRSLDPSVLVACDEKTITIRDGYPKAKYHYLVLPRIPFQLEKAAAVRDQVHQDEQQGSSKETLRVSGGRLSLGPSKSDRIPPFHLESLESVLASPHCEQVFSALRRSRDVAVDLMRSEMVKDRQDGRSWDIMSGFHAIPSMEHVHLHIISNDLVSEKLKNKKHYNSFRPDLGFWLPFEEVESYVHQGLKKLPKGKKEYESLLKSPLVSFRDGSVHSNLPGLKAHLLSCWEGEMSKASGGPGSSPPPSSSSTPPQPRQAGDQSRLKRKSSQATSESEDEVVLRLKR
ncbi:hypothetical protein IE53DRAFT_384027 [Violaceomyces palustris]|uniref:Uncharacterized protein n=1 Tax=Violaceomyces palustris TaxID=1673888 RepID=A0ACD0P5Z1_9BASI|nr:hypothetical protein IE53DRAFT_384027 [Violaceomyces palustris]